MTEAAVKAVNDNALSGLEEKIENKIAESVVSALNSNNGILLSGYSHLEQELLLKAVQQSCFNITKTSKHTQVLNELAGGVFCATGSHYAIGAAFQGIQRAATTIDAITKIEPILDDIKEQAITIITKAASQANTRLNGKTVTSEHNATRESLSHNIGKIAANAVMNFINRKVTAPIIGQLTSNVVNDLVKDFQAKQFETLAAYSAAAAASTTADSRPAAVGAGDVDTSNSTFSKKRKPFTDEEKTQLVALSGGEFDPDSSELNGVSIKGCINGITSLEGVSTIVDCAEAGLWGGLVRGIPGALIGSAATAKVCTVDACIYGSAESIAENLVDISKKEIDNNKDKDK